MLHSIYTDEQCGLKPDSLNITLLILYGHANSSLHYRKLILCDIFVSFTELIFLHVFFLRLD